MVDCYNQEFNISSPFAANDTVMTWRRRVASDGGDSAALNKSIN